MGLRFLSASSPSYRKNTGDETYRDPDKWTRMPILNTIGLGKFSSDRTIREDAEEIWRIEPVDKIFDNAEHRQERMQCTLT